MRILLVDEDERAATELTDLLARAGHAVARAAFSDQAWRMLQSDAFGMVVCSAAATGIDGLEMCRRIRCAASDSYTYVLMVTERGGRDERLEALGAGADDYLVKPVDPAEVMARLLVAERILGVHAELARQRTELARTTAQLAHLVVTDSLTGLGDRRRFGEQLARSYSMARRHSMPLAVAMLDVDHFKRYNDAYGHMAGDDVLRQIAALLSATLRQDDCVARYGGEEFAMLLTASDTHGACAAAERVRRAIESHPWPLQSITASVGLACYTPACTEPDDLLRHADRALYYAKHLGRNRVVRCDGAEGFVLAGGGDLAQGERPPL